MARRKRIQIDYALEEDEDFLNPLVWPDRFAKKPAYALLRPLSEYSNPWRKSPEAVTKYLNGQARRLGGRYYVNAYFTEIAPQAKQHPILYAFLLAPFEKHSLPNLLPDLERFLRKVFTSGEMYVKRAINPQYLADIESCFNKSFIKNALKECPELLSRSYNEDFTKDMFSSPVCSVCMMWEGDYCVVEMPVVLGSHYLNNKGLSFLKKKNYIIRRILGCYARWDEAIVVLYSDKVSKEQMFEEIKKESNLMPIGKTKNLLIDSQDYLVSLLIDSDLPPQAFTIEDWEVNSPKLTVLKDTQ